VRQARRESTCAWLPLSFRPGCTSRRPSPDRFGGASLNHPKLWATGRFHRPPGEILPGEAGLLIVDRSTLAGMLSAADAAVAQPSAQTRRPRLWPA
jgi:hypothetical protein